MMIAVPRLGGTKIFIPGQCSCSNPALSQSIYGHFGGGLLVPDDSPLPREGTIMGSIEVFLSPAVLPFSSFLVRLMGTWDHETCPCASDLHPSNAIAELGPVLQQTLIPSESWQCSLAGAGLSESPGSNRNAKGKPFYPNYCCLLTPAVGFSAVPGAGDSTRSMSLKVDRDCKGPTIIRGELAWRGGMGSWKKPFSNSLVLF